MKMLAMAAVGAALLVSGCSITQDITPVTTMSANTICIIENPATRATFLAEYERVLQNRGFDTRRLPAGSTNRDCPMTTTYVARWSWDLTIYMSYVELHVFDEGRLTGHVEYDARRGGGRMDKFVDAETKIGELVTELFPIRPVR
jgi:hypothetical protein